MACAISPGTLHGARIDWDDANAVSQGWSDGANWAGGSVPGASDTAKFGSEAVIDFQPVVSGTVTINKLEIDNSQDDWQIGGSGATIAVVTAAGDDIRVRGDGTTIFQPNLVISGSAEMKIKVDSADGTLQMDGDVTGATLRFRIDGNGTTIFNGDGSFSGTMDLRKGTILVNGDFSAATGDVSVGTGATLGGTGTIGGETVVADGQLAPGAPGQTGALTFSQGLTLEAAATWLLDISSATDYDVVNVGGDLVLANGATLDITGPADISQLNGSLITFATITGTTTGDWTNVTYNGGPLPDSVSLSGGQLGVAIPEPSTIFPLLLLLGPWVMRRSRRKGRGRGLEGG